MTGGENEVVFDAEGVREELRITRRRTEERETRRVNLLSEEVSVERAGVDDARADAEGTQGGDRASHAATRH